MKEFDLIQKIVSTLGDRAEGEWVKLGPGDDCSIVSISSGHELVSSIDSLSEGVHFPIGAEPELVGYRSLMVSFSDIAAMGAIPKYALINLSLPEGYAEWALDFASGLKRAATDHQIFICGGNVAQGNLIITVSAHGEVPKGQAVLRSGAKRGHFIYVSGHIGGAAAYIRKLSELSYTAEELKDLKSIFFEPKSCLNLDREIRNSASSCIDISDGLSQDLAHLLSASSVGAELNSNAIPLFSGANLSDALYGGDDYQLLFTSAKNLPDFWCIGEIIDRSGVFLDGRTIDPKGYDHFIA